MKTEEFTRYIFDNVDSIVLRDIETSEPGQIAEIINPIRLSEEMKYLNKKYKADILKFLKSEWKWHETDEDVFIDNDFVEVHLNLNISLNQLIKKLSDIRTNFSFMHKVYQKTVASDDFLLIWPI